MAQRIYKVTKLESSLGFRLGFFDGCRHLYR